MLCNQFLISLTFFAGAIAFPFAKNATRTLVARAPINTPSIAQGFSATETQQIVDGISDAFELASYVRTSSSGTVNPIFLKYFNDGDQDTVYGVFDTILGGDPRNPPGNELLKQITISPDFPNQEGKLTCADLRTGAALRGWYSSTPILILCSPATLGHGGIGKGYPDEDIDAVGCDVFDPRVSWKMDTVGATLLHEYTHWTLLMTSGNPGPLTKETEDLADGVYDVRQLDKSMATNNADSYTWFAIEVLWTVICQTQYQDPELEDQDDPNCSDSACSSPVGDL